MVPKLDITILTEKSVFRAHILNEFTMNSEFIMNIFAIYVLRYIEFGVEARILWERGRYCVRTITIIMPKLGSRLNLIEI